MPTKAPSEPTKRSQPRRTRGLDRNLHRRLAEHLLAISLVLLLEQLEARHGDDARRRTVLLQDVACVERDLDLGAAGEDRDLRLTALCGCELICALCRQVLGDVFGAHRAQVLAGQHQRRGRLGRMDRGLPALSGLRRIRRAEHQMVGDRPHGGEMLDRLVGRAVFAQPDRIVRHDEERADAHQRGEPHCGTRIVGEAEEGAAIGDQPAMQRDAVDGGGHRMLADAVVNVTVGRSCRPTVPWSGWSWCCSTASGRQSRRSSRRARR